MENLIELLTFAERNTTAAQEALNSLKGSKDLAGIASRVEILTQNHIKILKELREKKLLIIGVLARFSFIVGGIKCELGPLLYNFNSAEHLSTTRDGWSTGANWVQNDFEYLVDTLSTDSFGFVCNFLIHRIKPLILTSLSEEGELVKGIATKLSDLIDSLGPPSHNRPEGQTLSRAVFIFRKYFVE